MVYKLEFHIERIKKINNPIKLTMRQAKKAVQIDPEHLHEKNNWYIVMNVLHYFKARQDCRVLGELLTKSILDLFERNTADYQLVLMLLGKVEKIGLLSPNIQKADYEYYDVSNLYRLFPEMPRKYGQYTIRGLLNVLRINEVPDCETLTNDIITTYILDWFCHQLDRNPRNLLFERSKEGNLYLPPLIDSESSFTINGNGLIDTDYQKIWIPSIPYEDTEFSKNPIEVEGCDYNILGVLMDYPEIVFPILKQLTDTNLDSIINQYQHSMSSKVSLSDDAISFLKDFIYKKQEESNKLLKLV